MNKSWRDIHWKHGGFSDQDIETLKRAYPDVNWENTFDRKRWLDIQRGKREARSKARAKQKLR